MTKPRVLLLDIETSPVVSYTWGLFDQNVALNQIKEDWYILSYSAKWLGESKVLYRDQRNAKDLSNDKPLLVDIWRLLDECDVLITQNGVSFDTKKINARFVFHGMKPPSPYKNIDTYQIAKRHFGFTSNKLEYMTDKLCARFKKSAHKKFPGFELWKQCLARNKEAFKEMEQYNKMDVLSLEELYTKISPWDKGVSFSMYTEEARCNCGSYNLEKRGYSRTLTGRLQRFQCRDCGAWHTERKGKSGAKIKRGA